MPDDAPKTPAAPRRVNPFTRSVPGLIGLVVLALLAGVCIFSMPWTMGRAAPDKPQRYNDGSLATVAIKGTKADITHSAPFFSATDDPIFDNFTYDKRKQETTFLTYTGQIFQAKLGATPTIAAPFSIQAAAGIRPGATKPLELNWYPGGRQPMALHRPSGHLFVLMHMGEYWTHKASGTEVWEVDLATQKVVKRRALKEPMNNIEVSQTDKPLLFMNGEEASAIVIDLATGEEKHKIDRAGGSTITVADPS